MVSAFVVAGRGPRSCSSRACSIEATSRANRLTRRSYYGHKKKLEGGEAKPRTKRRETTAADALADARAALERSIASIDREVEVAEERAREYAAEAKDLKESAAARKKAISERLEALS